MLSKKTKSKIKNVAAVSGIIIVSAILLVPFLAVRLCFFTVKEIFHKKDKKYK